MRACYVEKCEREAVAHGICLMHYKRRRKSGTFDTSKGSPLDTPEERLRRHGWTVAATGCWEWAGRRDRYGHGNVTFGGRDLPAHRLAHRAWVGPVPQGVVVRHRCDNPPCINPEHLLLGSQRDNMQDMVDRRRFYSRLSEAQVIEIKARLRAGEVAMRICREYGVNASTLSRIRTGDTWKGVE